MFALTKYIWLLVRPAHLLLLALLASLLLLLARRKRLGLALLSLCCACLLFLALFPVGNLLLAPLEDRFPRPEALPDKIDGIIVLGGSEEAALSRARGMPLVNEAGDRLTAFTALARRYPGVRLYCTGGSGSLDPDAPRNFEVSSSLFRSLGLDPDRVAFDTASRNTWTNAVNLLDMARPKPGQTWLLVTSAWHMPRAVGCFRAAGWPDVLVPWPTDYRTFPDNRLYLDTGLLKNLQGLDTAAHEWLGLAAYRLMGRTDALFPAPAAQ